MNKFELCKNFTLKAEGGFVDDPRDNGGATNFGITQSTLTAWRKCKVSRDDVKNMTKEEAEEIYKYNYYDRIRCDEFPAEIAITLFDCAVNSGCRQAVLILQRALGIKDDGIMGNQTVRAGNKCDSFEVANECINMRLEFMKKLKSWNAFGKGWTSRLMSLKKYISNLED